jgi:hypothetical protein
VESGGYGQRSFEVSAPLKGVASAKGVVGGRGSEHLGLGGSNPTAVEAGIAMPQPQTPRIVGACERAR